MAGTAARSRRPAKAKRCAACRQRFTPKRRDAIAVPMPAATGSIAARSPKRASGAPSHGTGWNSASGHVHRALDFRLGLLDIVGVRVARQILMRPGMRSNRHAGLDYLLGDLRMPVRMLADLEEGRFQAFVGQRLE